MEYRYEFCVYNITEAQAEALMNAIEDQVEEMDANVGGGYGEASPPAEDES